MAESVEQTSMFRKVVHTFIWVHVGAVVLVLVIIMITQLVTNRSGGSAENDNAVLARIKPVGEITVGQAAPAADATAAGGAAPAAVGGGAPSAGGATAVATADTGKPDGKAIYESTCVACHGAGVLGAPKFGDKAAWAPRLAQGMNTLYQSALNGKNAMPPKGGNANLNEAQVKAAVDYLTSAAK